MSEGTAPVPPTPTSDLVSLSPSKAKWIHRERHNFQKAVTTDIAMLLNHHGMTDLVAVSWTPNSGLAGIASAAGLITERWTKEDYDLSTEQGYIQAEQRLRSLRPKRIWLSPESEPFMQMQYASPEQIDELEQRCRIGFKQWKIAFGWLGYKWNLVVTSTLNNQILA